jgi:prefoldin subunit 5
MNRTVDQAILGLKDALDDLSTAIEGRINEAIEEVQNEVEDARATLEATITNDIQQEVHSLRGEIDLIAEHRDRS